MSSSEASFVSNRTSSSRPKVYTCDVVGCEKAYSKPSLLEQHKRSHSNERPFKCTFPRCSKTFLRKAHLQVHMLSHESEEGKPYHCSVCGKGVNTLQHLKRHEITHTKSFVCTYEGCEESFYKHQSLRHHILSVHEKKLYCARCNKSFNRPYRLAQHNIKYHSDTPVYQCDHQGCFSNFQTWSALQLHIKTEHPKIKCPICGKGCVGSKGLKSHMITHDESKVTPFWNCKYCDMGKFVKKVDLIEHYNNYHDGNVPEELMNSKRKIEEISNSNEAQDVSSLRESFFLEEQEREASDFELESKAGVPFSKNSMKSLTNDLTVSKNSERSIRNIISNNYSVKKLGCPVKNCDRRFRRDYDLQRHLNWHQENLKKIDAYLESLGKFQEISEKSVNELVMPKKSQVKTNQEEEPILNYTENFQKTSHQSTDLDLDDLIDSELKTLKAGEAS